MMTGAAEPTILFVCTGNICRSPYMEYRLRAMLTERGVPDVSIGSAGTRALEGHTIAEPMARRLREHGIDASGFRASALGLQMLDAAGVVVTATREHRREVVRHRHDLAERVFTLTQLARLLDASASDSTTGAAGPVADLLAAAHAARGVTTAGTAREDDMEDPWQRSRRSYRRVANRIDELLIPMATRLVAGG